MGLLHKLRTWRENRLYKKMASKELAKLDKLEENAFPVSPVLPAEGISKQMGEVTGSYRTVSAMMREMIDEKKKGRNAARRISDSVGVVPVAKK